MAVHSLFDLVHGCLRAAEHASCGNVGVSAIEMCIRDSSISVASRVIGNDLTDDEHRKIVERYVNEAGSFNAN